MPLARRVLLGSALAAAGIAIHGAANAADWFLPWRWKSRLLVLFAPTEDDAKLANQRALLQATSAGSAERDLALLEVVGYHSSDSRVTGSALRLVYKAPLPNFCVVLIGKDGQVKMRSQDPVTTDRLFAIIDAMPMRSEEISGVRAP